MLPFLPGWIPASVQLVLLVAAVLVVAAYALMPFSVFGLKARLDALDDRLDALQSDIRALTNRLPDPEMRNPAAWRRGEADEDDFARAPARRDRPPPVPPAPSEPARSAGRGTIERLGSAEREQVSPRVAPIAPPARPRRSEPQLNWPENRPRH